MTLWPIQHWLILICFALLTHPKPTLLITNSSLFENISSSLIRTHSFMARLTLLLSTIEGVGTEFVKPSGMFSNPIVISFTTQARVWCADLLRSRRCWCPHYFSLRCFIIWPLFIGPTQTVYPKLAASPQKVFGSATTPIFFYFFYITHYGPLWGVMSGFSATHWRLSNSHPTFLSGPIETLLRLRESSNFCYSTYLKQTLQATKVTSIYTLDKSIIELMILRMLRHHYDPTLDLRDFDR